MYMTGFIYRYGPDKLCTRLEQKFTQFTLRTCSRTGHRIHAPKFSPQILHSKFKLPRSCPRPVIIPPPHADPPFGDWNGPTTVPYTFFLWQRRALVVPLPQCTLHRSKSRSASGPSGTRQVEGQHRAQPTSVRTGRD